MKENSTSVGRRNFIRDSGLMIAGGAISGAVTAAQVVQSGERSPIRVAVLGCGRRARTLMDALLSAGGAAVEVVALGDCFASQTQAMYRSLKGRFPEQVADQCIRADGMECYRRVLDSNADLVYLTAAPYCRPDHFREAVEAGKNVFLEKALASDLAGLTSVMETGVKAKQSGLSVHVGFQRRHDPMYQDIVRQIQDGAIGTPLFGRAFCNAGPLPRLDRKTKKTGLKTQLANAKSGEADLEFQIRNWNHFQWTGGDFLVEQHVAGLDLIHWALGDTPKMAQGQGGWGDFAEATKTTENALERLSSELDLGKTNAVGEVFDHHHVEFEFDSGVHLMSQCRRVAKAWNTTSEHLHGTLGRADLSSGTILSHDGQVLWQSEFPRSRDSGTRAQAEKMLSSLMAGEPSWELDSAVSSTLFAMLGHEASLTRKRVRMDRFARELA